MRTIARTLLVCLATVLAAPHSARADEGDRIPFEAVVIPGDEAPGSLPIRQDIQPTATEPGVFGGGFTAPRVRDNAITADPPHIAFTASISWPDQNIPRSSNSGWVNTVVPGLVVLETQRYPATPGLDPDARVTATLEAINVDGHGNAVIEGLNTLITKPVGPAPFRVLAVSGETIPGITPARPFPTFGGRNRFPTYINNGNLSLTAGSVIFTTPITDDLVPFGNVGDPVPAFGPDATLEFATLNAALYPDGAVPVSVRSGGITLTGSGTDAANFQLDPPLPQPGAEVPGTVQQNRTVYSLLTRDGDWAYTVESLLPGNRTLRSLWVKPLDRSTPQLIVQSEVLVALRDSNLAGRAIFLAHDADGPLQDGYYILEPTHTTSPDEPAYSHRFIVGFTGPAPGLAPGVTFAQLPAPKTSLTFNNKGHVVFLAELQGPGITSGNNLSLWAHIPGEGLRLVVQEGDEIAEGTVHSILFTADTFAATGLGALDQSFSAGPGNPTGLSDDGVLVFADSSLGIFKAQLPGGDVGPVILPSISDLTPAPDSSNVPANSGLGATIDPGTVGIKTGSVVLEIDGDGELILPVLKTDAEGRILVRAQPKNTFPLGGRPKVQLRFTDNDGNEHSKEWEFLVSFVAPPDDEDMISLANASIENGDLCLTVEGGEGIIHIQRIPGVDSLGWETVLTTDQRDVCVSVEGDWAFYRIVGTAPSSPSFNWVGSSGDTDGQISFDGESLSFDVTIQGITFIPIDAIVEVRDGVTGLTKFFFQSLVTVVDPDSGTVRLANDLQLHSFFGEDIDGDDLIVFRFLESDQEFVFEPEVTDPQRGKLVPVNLATTEAPDGETVAVEPNICTCIECEDESGMIIGSSLAGFTRSYTPTVHGVELAGGRIRTTVPITTFETRKLGFDFHLIHSSLVDYDGPWGQGVSHSFNMMIVMEDADSGSIVTPDLRVFPIDSTDGVNWTLPDGFFSKLVLDADSGNFHLTHFSGLEVEFLQADQGQPAYPVAISDPNGNTTRLDYDVNCFLQNITTDLGQVITFTYNDDGRLETCDDPIGRAWDFQYDAVGNLENVVLPETTYADISAGELLTDSDLAEVVKTQSRVITMTHDDPQWPTHMTDYVDPRLATPLSIEYDDDGRVATQFINGNPQQYIYGPSANPTPRAPLDPGNFIVRVTDREGNVVDCEMVGAGQTGQYGIRRKVIWTETGRTGNAANALREGEPEFWEQRWLQDCDCLAPAVVTQPFSSQDLSTIAMDDDQLPTNWPRTIRTYNDHRQVTVEIYTDGDEIIRTEMTYQPSAFGEDGQYSRMVSRTDPRAFDDNPVYAGDNQVERFTHSYLYDQRGNPIRHIAPIVTLGVPEQQTIEETRVFNDAGQVVSRTDANGNVTAYEYFSAGPAAGDINTKGEIAGYLSAVTHGAAGSADAVTALRETFKVNPLGMVTQRTDPNGFVYEFVYNDLQEQTEMIEPVVTLRDGAEVHYVIRFIHDGVGNRVMTRRLNLDVDGTTPETGDEFVDVSASYDDANNILAFRREVDRNDDHDLIQRFAYDRNDRLAIEQQPEGNRTFHIHDERSLRFKTFYGVAPGSNLESGYPLDGRASNLGLTDFVGVTVETYDARGNRVRTRDGRGNDVLRLHDFRNRLIAESDANGNGWRRFYDDASNALIAEVGAVDQITGAIIAPLQRSYFRFDEAGRKYQTVHDIDLTGSEADALDPSGSGNSSYLTRFDSGSRVVLFTDANGNETRTSYDAANRRVSVTDALDNVREFTYDANSNILSLTDTEVPGPDATGAPETYVSAFQYDALNRRVEAHELGLDGNSIDHVTRTEYDSRGNARLVEDAEGNYVHTAYDTLDRRVSVHRFDGDPLSGATELLRTDFVYNGNGRTIEDRTYSDVSDPGSVQITAYAYDDLDRPVRTVYPDSDDPIDGSGNGVDGIFDRLEVVYDPNSNPVEVTDQRGVVYSNTFDPVNRLTRQDIDIANTGAMGVTRQQWVYDPLNRIVGTANNYALLERAFDPLSRLTSETQSIRLDGSGEIASSATVGGVVTLTHNYEHPVGVLSEYDPQSNKLGYSVLDRAATDLEVVRSFDPLNRIDAIDAAYFSEPRHSIADYAYIGPDRVLNKTLGNGAVLSNTFDVKRRLASHVWRSAADNLLVGFEYSNAAGDGYDRVNNGLYERFLHDNDLYDHFLYSGLYAVVGVEYRWDNPTPPTAPATTIDYDDFLIRKFASFGDPFASDPNTEDTYASNPANEYTQIVRDGIDLNPEHDRAGNMTLIPVRPVTGVEDQDDVTATATWDALNRLFHIDTDTDNPAQDDRYDPLGRRIATLTLLNSSDIGDGSRRYIYDGWRVVEERLFEPGASLSSAPSTLERVYVDGIGSDEHLLAAMDRDGDGELGGANTKNQRDIDADQEYYLLGNRLGSTMALLDADNSERTLEYYRYTPYGEATVLPTVEDASGLETTPTDLGDNAAIGTERSSHEYGNPYLAGGKRFDAQTGLYETQGGSKYEPRTGTPLQRHPGGPKLERDVLGMLSSGLYTAFAGWWLDSISNLIDAYGPAGLFAAMGQGLVAVATIPVEIAEAAFYSYGDMRGDIAADLDALNDLDEVILDRFFANRDLMPQLRNRNPARYAELERHFASDLHWKFGYFVQWLTDDRITAWEAMNFWPEGGLTGPDQLGTQSVGLDNVTCSHDSVLNLYESMGVGPGGGFLRKGSIFSGMVSHFLRIVFSGEFGMTGFGDPGAAGLDRPWGSQPGEQTPERRHGSFGAWGLFDEGYDATQIGPPLVHQ